jgi:hypothetical protein
MQAGNKVKLYSEESMDLNCTVPCFTRCEQLGREGPLHKYLHARIMLSMAVCRRYVTNDIAAKLLIIHTTFDQYQASRTIMQHDPVRENGVDR